MLSGNHLLSQSRLWVSVWPITWVTTVPVYHIHFPDISNRQAAQIGVAHTVLSPDLPDEFSRFSDAKSEAPFPQLSHWAFNSLELGSVLSEGSKDREKGKPLVLGVRGSLPDQPSMPSSAIESLERHGQRLVLSIPQCPRAPPSVVSS